MGVMKYTPEEIVQTLKDTKGLQAHAAQKLGCHISTIWRYAQRFPKVQAEIQQQRETWLDTAEYKLYEKIQAGDLGAICFFLKTQGKARKYSERLEMTGADGQAIKTEQTTVVVGNGNLTSALSSLVDAGVVKVNVN